MITIISGTNRTDSISLKIAQNYQSRLHLHKVNNLLLSLENLEVWNRTPMRDIENRYLVPAEKFIFILPEYNASFPGIVKVMMDNSDIKKCWWHKKALLTGISEGRGGNIRGLEHMTSILHYMKVNVHYNKLLLSRIKEEIDLSGQILKTDTDSAITEQLEQFISF